MALDLGRWLKDRKKQVEGIQSQLNPLDGNKTYNTVINNRQPTGYSAPAQRTRQPGQTTQQLVDNSYGTGLSAVTNRFKDLLDGNTQADNIRRYAQSGLNESYGQQQKRLTNQAMNTSEGRNGVNQFSAGSLSGVTDFFGKTPGSLAQLQGRVANATNSIDNPVLRTATKLVASPGTLFQGKKQADRQIQAGKDMNSFVENKKQQSGIGQRKDDNSWIYGAGNVGTQLPAQLASGPIGLIGQTAQMGADEANKAEASGKSNNYALTVAAAQAIPSYLSEKWGLDRFLPGEGSGSNMAINAVKRFATEGGQEAQQQFTQNLIANKLYDPTQGLKDGVLQSGVLGGLAGGFGSVATDSFDAPAGSLREKIRGAKQANNIQTDQRQIARPEEARVLSDYQDTLLGNIQSGSLINQIHRDARAIADKLGVDITSGSTRDINDRINAVLEQPLQQQNIQDPVVTNMPVYQQADPQSMIERMKVAKDRVLNPQKMNEGGFIAGPLALDFSKAKSEGKVFEGVDGKPRFEVSDEGAKLNDIAKAKPSNGEYLRLEDVLTHDKLFSQYPQLKDIPVNVKKERGSVAHISSIKVGGKDKYAMTVSPTADKSTVLHEVQHLIQGQEGFARGGDNKSFRSKPQTSKVKDARFKRTIAKIMLEKNLNDAGYNFGTKLSTNFLDPQVVSAIKKIGIDKPSILEQYDKYLAQNEIVKKNPTASDQYRNLAGEAESRAVENRINMTDAERQSKGFYDSLDVPKKDLIIRDGSGKAMSVDPEAPQVGKTDKIESLKQEARKYKSAEEFVKAYESKTRSEYTDRFNKSLELLPEKPRVVKKGITKRSAEVGNTISKRADAQVVENVDAGLAVMREASNKDQSLTGRWMDAVKTKNVPDQYKRYDVIDGKVKTSFVDMSPEESRTFYEKNRPLFQDGTLLYENDRIYSNTPKINKEQLTSLYNENNGIIDGNVYDNNTSRTQGVSQKTGSLQKKAGAKQTSQNTRPVQSTRLLATQPPKSTPKTVEAKTDRWSTPLPDTKKTPIPTKLDSNGVQIKEGDKIEFYGASPGGKKGTSTIRWEGPSKANASGKEFAGQWLGNGTLDNNIPFKIIERDGKPFSALTEAKPFKPLSQPVDNTPAIAKQVTKKTTPKPDKIAEALGLSAQDVATSTQEQYNRAATNSTSGADMKKLIESFGKDNAVTEAAKKAVQTGKQLDFYAKKDANDRGVGIERFDPKYHRIESGYVVDKKGNILGNHISVDETGIQVNVGGKIVNMEGVLGDVNQWGNRKGVTSKALGNYRLSETMNRNIDNSAPTKEIANATKQFLWGHKVKSEANMRTELDTQYKDLGNRVKNTNKAKPRGVSSTQWKDDIFGVMNGDLTDAQIKSKYDAKPAQAILNYKNETRAVYDSLLQRINTERVKFGQEEIQPRKDYITHLQEMKGSKSFVQEVAGQMRNSFADEGMARTRGTVPGDIAGRTEGFKPISKYNPYLQQRTGTKSLRDPYVAVQEYLQPALYNIHMTESGARARAVESAFRTAEQLKRMNPDQYLKESNTILDKYKKASPDNAKLITGFQEYANAIAGKTQRFDRQITDSSEAGRLGLKGWQGLQRIGGRGTILGNLSSVLAQPLNLTMNIADAGGINSVRGIAESLGDGGDIEKSNFIRARQTEPTKPIRGKGEKANDAGGFLLQQAELASVKLIWHTQHQKALQAGFKGQEAISQADLNTERVVAGRGIADKPELYRSTAANGILQYTLEVNAQNKAFWQDLNTTQKMKFMVAASATNALMGAITGFEPLPDFLKAIFETGKDFLDDGNDESGMSKAVHGGQRLLDQYASMNPLIGAPANALLPQSTRKSIFGSDGDTGRYPGGSAPIGVIKGAVDAGSNLAKTEYAKAAKAGVKLLPGGNQIKKTVTGAQAIADGQTEGSKLQAAKALAFGPNAINTDTAKTAQPWRADTKAAAKTTGELGTASDVEEILKGQFDTKEGRAFLALKDEDKKLKAESDPAIKEMYDQYKTTKRINADSPVRPDGLSKESKDILDWQAKRTVQQREKLAYSQNDYDFKLAKAKYEENKLNGTISRADDINAQQALRKAAVGADFTKDTRESYNALSKAELQALAENDPNGKKIWEDALAYGDALVKAGLTKKNKLRTGSGGGRGGRGSKANTSLLNFYKLQAQTSSDLQKLLAGTSFKGKASVSSPKTGKVAQRRITVNTKA